jgi:23S rRNA-/tRNA-specific pseudouridylate synthase
MHQIRVQMAQIGHPVLGDTTYGNKEENKKWSKYLKRQFLHASSVKFKNPMTKKLLSLEAPISRDLKKVLEKMD